MVEVTDTPKKICDGLVIRGINHFCLDALIKLFCCGIELFIGARSDNDLSTSIHGLFSYCITNTGATTHDHNFFVFKHCTFRCTFRLHKF